MQETIKESEIISWLTGFFDAEGCVRINKSVRKNKYTTYRPVIILNNTDIATMDYCISLLEMLGISMYVRTSKPTSNRKTVKYIEVSRITHVIRLCDVLLPFSINKYDELLLIKRFCISRRDRFLKHAITNNKLSYNDYEIALYEKSVMYKAHTKGKKCLVYMPIFIDTPNEITWNWLSGYIDGDGSFSINKRGLPSFSVGTTNPTTSKMLGVFFNSSYFNYCFYSNLPSKNHLKCCKLRMYQYFINDVSDILEVIRRTKKYLISKYTVVELMEEYCGLRLNNKGKWRTEYEKSFVARVSKLTL